MELARRFNGTVNLADQPLPVSFAKVGNPENPDLIVTSLKVEIGVILKPGNSGHYYIDSTSRYLAPAVKDALEDQLNEIIHANGAAIDLHHTPCRPLNAA